MKKCVPALLLLSLLAACGAKSAPPQLWSDQKYIAIPAADCAIKGEEILKSLNFTSVVRKDQAAYGNFSSNRAALKCVDVPAGSYVFVAVAGVDKKEVETFRNKIVQAYK
jgi:ADP-dependent phosphofructokinase/glucokinase